MRPTAVVFTSILSLVLGASVAAAQEEATMGPSVPPTRSDGGRFRFGVNGSAGFESVSSVAGPMFGLDLRFGYQINDLLAIYAQPHLSFGALSTSGGGASITGATGTLAGTVMGEVTIGDRFFGGAGVGYGILNNPSGFTLAARAGGYLFQSNDDDGLGRSGLMLGVDFKTVFLSGVTGVLVAGCIGYESF